MSENKKEEKEKTTKWILPPGLAIRVRMFFELYISLFQNKPHKHLLIQGPTGAGKSLFLDLFIDLFKIDHPNLEQKNIPIITANCAHFGGKASDPNIARCELFGMKKDFAATIGRKNFKQDMPGLLEKAQDGLLVLEEIGDLPSEVEAMLLTFIETGKFRRAGGTEELNSQVQIISSTNKPEELRHDFRQRFFPFYVPGLSERRRDILYMIGSYASDILRTLRSYDVLALICYDWPGNVRELEMEIDVIRWMSFWDDFYKKKKRSNDSDESIIPASLKLFKAGELYSSLGPGYDVPIGDEFIKSIGIKAKDLESAESKLNRYGLSINPQDKIFPFRSFEGIKYYKKSGFYPAMINEPLFERAYKGIKNLFGDVSVQRNLLKPLNHDDLSKNPGQLSSELSDSAFSMSKEELLYAYYTGLLLRAEGNLSKAASRAGMSESAFREYCNHHHIPRKSR